jgi:hypothetical protein
VKPEEMASHSSEETHHNPDKSSDKPNVNVCSFCQKVHRVHNGPYNEFDAAQSEYKLPSIHFYVAIGAQETKTKLPPIQPNRQTGFALSECTLTPIQSKPHQMDALISHTDRKPSNYVCGQPQYFEISDQPSEYVPLITINPTNHSNAFVLHSGS